MLSNIVEETLAWFAAAKQQPDVPVPNARQTAFYIGMQLEELAEKLQAVLGYDSASAARMAVLGNDFKTCAFDTEVEAALKRCPRELLDGDIDLLWVTLGAARAQGADVMGAYGEVFAANWAKQWPDGTFHLSEHGKVLKPQGWVPPNLEAYVHPSLRSSA